jgi:PIN domain nuclease of toxin-antitoxin system
VGSKAHLDTHIALWLHDTLIEKISPAQAHLIETSDVFISQFVRLELHYLFEIGRINIKPDTIISFLSTNADILVSTTPLQKIMNEAVRLQWTRDPFDRLITANALAEKASLLTQDSTILRHCSSAVG